jgi:hypothetical protein
MNQNKYSFLYLILIISIFSCAKKGTITGGLKDTNAPILKISFPENGTTNFKGKEIKLTFNEFIKLKNLNKQLIISPPMQYEPSILPTTPSKYITIKIKDTLKPNTTYSFNFGQSIADNNEGNPYNQFKYIFSTGSYIDSLALGGKIKDAYDKEVVPFVSIMLYEVNNTYNDSIIYKENPRYVTNTLDSLKTFRLENLKAGKYALIALKDNNNNNKFNPKTDKIGFLKQYITIPNDTVFELELFKEVPSFKTYKPTQESSNRLVLGYDGKQDFTVSKPKITLKNGNQTLSTIVTKLAKKDSLQIWFQPIKTDSLNILIEKESYTQKFNFKIKNLKKDTLSISAVQNNILNFRDRFALETTTPLVAFDFSKITLFDSKGQQVPFTTEYDAFNQRLYLDFKKEPSEKYNFNILPKALTDFYEKSNDSLKFNFNTKAETDYGNLIVTLQNIKSYPIIVELTNAKGDIIASEYCEKNPKVAFKFLEPAVFTIRAIYDLNKNRRYDSGNYLQKKYSEEVIYLSKDVDVRANWEWEQVFDLSLPYIPEVKKKAIKKKNKY